MRKVYTNSKLCQECAKCCKEFRLVTESEDEALRFEWLNSKKISVEKINDGNWLIIFHINCKQLVQKNGKYYCKVWKDKRPEFCLTYPKNFEELDKDVLNNESKFCPALKEVLEINPLTRRT
jgi:Fe-S-cluster containining protein